jgi:hypothetical protein
VWTMPLRPLRVSVCPGFPHLGKKLHLSPKTICNWIRFGDIGEEDGIFDVHGRILIHWPTSRRRQFKPLRRPNGAL